MAKSKLVKEFSEFINKGNVMDMAVGIIIGGAFTSIVNALIDSIINPVITAVTGGSGSFSGWSIAIPGTDQAIDFGAFVSAVINFLVIALVVFFMVKGVNKSREMAEKAAKGIGIAGKGEEEAKPEPHTCPYCTSEIPEAATRCPHCSSILPNATPEQIAAMTGR